MFYFVLSSGCNYFFYLKEISFFIWVSKHFFLLLFKKKWFLDKYKAFFHFNEASFFQASKRKSSRQI